ncbi:MAG TPA: hypothetical protein VHL53_02725, partial [Acidimicrobiia bacterium]|nr:hypothetical protein [Acidimicrobiia bacterium]
MDIAALIVWVITALGGFVLLFKWVAAGGHKPDTQPPSRLAPGQVFGHFLLAAAGLVLWIIYVAADSDALSWISFVILLVVALIGFTMFFRWLPQVQATGGAASSGSASGSTRTATRTGTP